MPSAGELIRASDAIQDAWTSYTPSWTSSGTAPALGNGTLTGEYQQVGDLVYVKIVWQAGSTTTYGTGTYRFSLPVAPELDEIIPCFVNDSSGSGRYPGVAWIILASATGDNMRIIVADNQTGTGATSPFTFATSDKIVIEGWYRAA
jgi:hypothetical protein